MLGPRGLVVPGRLSLAEEQVVRDIVSGARLVAVPRERDACRVEVEATRER